MIDVTLAGEGFEVDPRTNRITSPGKFQGEGRHVPFFWNLAMRGFADRDDGVVFGFDLTSKDKDLFPELKGRRTVRLLEREDGFVVEV